MAFVLPARAELGRRTRNLALELLVPVVAIVAWWALSSGSRSLYFPPLSTIARAFVHDWLPGRLRTDAVPSLIDLAGGYLIATVVGVALGIALGLSARLSAALSLVLEALRAVPGVALLPTALLLFGATSRMRVSIIAFGAVWPILLNTIDGVRGMDPTVGDMARSYRLTSASRLRHIVIPGASPQIIAGMRTALSIAVTMIIFSEMFGSTRGIGFQLLATERSFDIPGLWATMILLGIIGYLLNVAFRGLEHVVLGWHRGMRDNAES